MRDFNLSELAGGMSMSGKDRIMEVLGGEDMLRLMVNANRFFYPDDSSVGFFVRGKQVYIKEIKSFSTSNILFYHIRITKRSGGDVFIERMDTTVNDASLIKCLLERDLKLCISF